MKKILTILITYILMISQTMAICDWKTIERVEDKFIYSSECHLEVGRLVKTEKEYIEEIGNLKKSLELKDIAINIADERTVKWKNEAFNQNDKLMKIEKVSKYNDLMYVGLGVGFTIISVWAASKLVK